MITTRDHIKGTMLIAMSEHHSGNADEARRIVDAQLAALEASGVRLVPVEATKPMTDAYWSSGGDGLSSSEAWDVMLAASPYAPEGTRND